MTYVIHLNKLRWYTSYVIAYIYSSLIAKKIRGLAKEPTEVKFTK